MINRDGALEAALKEVLSKVDHAKNGILDVVPDQIDASCNGEVSVKDGCLWIPAVVIECEAIKMLAIQISEEDAAAIIRALMIAIENRSLTESE